MERISCLDYCLTKYDFMTIKALRAYIEIMEAKRKSFVEEMLISNDSLRAKLLKAIAWYGKEKPLDKKAVLEMLKSLMDECVKAGWIPNHKCHKYRACMDGKDPVNHESNCKAFPDELVEPGRRRRKKMDYILTILDKIALTVLIEHVKWQNNGGLTREAIMDEKLLRQKVLDAAEWYESVDPSEISNSPFYPSMWKEYAARLQVIKKDAFFSGLPEDFKNYLLDYFGWER